ncbi:MAG TPA: nucleotidyltransferase domain-containing protein [Candidatus Acidoferrum sp.]|nr:nucleotidyltransferase domain-containing protein [Candidatus Acidoferrum sp.]
MIRLPDNIRKTLARIVNQQKIKENVYGIGLFGSWSRGDADPSSDVDLFILDKSDFAWEYVERIEIGGLNIDFDNVPKKWIQGMLPPETDQKLYEMQILYDRDWSLTNTKLLMVKSYSSPERVGIRTEAHVVDSDIYLSRATSAFSRGDFYSAYLFAVSAFENALKILIEIALEPLSNSHFVEKLEISTSKLRLSDLYEKYLMVSGLAEASDDQVKERLRLLNDVWSEAAAAVKQDTRVLESLHFRVKARLLYYLNLAFLQGVVARTNALVVSGKVAEASHYLNSILVEMLENYVWFKSSVRKVKIDYSTLIRCLERMEGKDSRNYRNIVGFLNLEDVDRVVVGRVIEDVREAILRIRRNRKILIKSVLSKS